MELMSIKVVQEEVDLIAQKLSKIPNVTIDYTPTKEQKNIYDHSLEAEPATLIAITIYLAGKIIPATINAIKEIIVDHLRCQKGVMIIKDKDGSEKIFIGPLNENADIQRLNRGIEKQLLPENQS